MKKHLLPTIILILVSIAACSQAPATPDDSSIQTAIAKTEQAQTEEETETVPTNTEAPPEPTNTPMPTETPKPTDTPEPSPTITNTPTEVTLEFIREQILSITIQALEQIDDIEVVNLVRFNDMSVIEIEVNTQYYSKDSQPIVSYDIIRMLANLYIKQLEIDSEVSIKIADGNEFIINIVTYSADGDYRYKSNTNYETLNKILNKQISYEEWISEAEAGFK